MNERTGTRLLIDAVNMSSPGGSLLQVEFARSVGRCCPPGSEVVFLTGRPAEELKFLDGIRPLTVHRPDAWLGYWNWFARTLPRVARDVQPDVVYSPGGIVSRPVSRMFATVNGINNMLPFTPEHIRHFRPWSKDRLRLVLLQKLYSRSSQRCDALVVPSRYAIDAMRPYAGDLSAKAFVAPNPIPHYVAFDPARPPAHPNGGKPYFFYLSVVFWYKNHLELVEGYRRASREDPSIPELIMAGVPTDTEYVGRIRRAIDDSSLGGRVRYLGKIPTADIPGWLHHAAVNLFPSSCETSSFVQAEIFGAHGVMACSNIGPMPEVAGGAAELFDPRDPDSIARTILRLWRDEHRRRELRALSARRVTELTPEACGEAIWTAVRHAAGTFGGRRPPSKATATGA